jgi:F-type H+-transporting ATPase subunit delta
MEEIATVYAQSLFEVAREHDSLDRIHEELGQFADTVAENHDLQTFFFSPYFSTQEKKDAVSDALEGADEHFVRFLELLAERNRLPAVFRMRRSFDRLWAREQRVLAVTVTSAIELDQDTVDNIGKQIEGQTDQTVKLEARVDPEILGGMVLRVGNMVLDASVRNRLEKLRQNVASGAGV